MKNKYFVIDFDSTFVKLEGLDELFKLSVRDDDKIVDEFERITRDGMSGKLSFSESLARRMKILNTNKEKIEELVELLRKNITKSIEDNREFFLENKDNIYIISGGFKEWIVPVVKDFGIGSSHVLANTFKYKKNGVVTGYDKSNLLAQSGGKVEQIKRLGIKGEIIIIGDGFTDYEIKKEGFASIFVAFTENVKRREIVDKADLVVSTFDEFLYKFDLPRKFSFPKSKINVLVLDNVNKVATQDFKEEGYCVRSGEYLTEENAKEELGDISVLCIRTKTKITEVLLENAPKLKVIAVYSIGTDHIDLKACSKRGIIVFNAPYSNTRSVVELALGAILILNRNLLDKDKGMHEGVWFKSSEGSHETRGKTLGIVGYGNIGSQLSVAAESIGMKVVYYDIADKLPLGNAYKCGSLDELLKVSDVISIHVAPRSKEAIFTKREFEKMKDGVLFLNLSRGYVVNLPDLKKFIQSGKVRGACIDVFPEEPKGNNIEFKTILAGLPNVFLTPHLGASTLEAQEHAGHFVTDKVIKFFNTGNSDLSVNFPNIILPVKKDNHRFIHIHENKSGILSKINSILSDAGLNIEGQYLKTNEDLGYVITDVNKKYKKEVIDNLNNVDSTIYFRVLY